MSAMLPLDDVQSLVLSAHPERPAARYGLFDLTDAARARNELGSLLPRVGRADRRHREEDRKARRHEPRLALAFGHAGLMRLGLDSRDVAGFPAPFLEGMQAPHRARELGDVGDAAPARWHSYWRTEPHLLVIQFSRDTDRDAHWQALVSDLAGGWQLRHAIDGGLNGGREPFGFRDGISQPYIAGSDTSRQPSGARAAPHAVAPGEFLLGHRNERGHFPVSPSVAGAADPRRGRLPDPLQPGRYDFGRNGSYLVVRQLEQHVQKFRDYFDRASPDPPERELLKAKFVGRWPDGAPLVTAPDAHDPSRADDNDFGYHAEDRVGHRCPIGAHIRRANPRDSLTRPEQGITPALAAAAVRQHRLIRRARVYDRDGEQGLVFVCVNTNLADQFEFVQHRWIHATEFGGLKDEDDPLVGMHAHHALGTGRLTLGAGGTRRVQADLPRFVTMRGGAYFFLPSHTALRFLTEL